jgi:hypothetical protein
MVSHEDALCPFVKVQCNVRSPGKAGSVTSHFILASKRTSAAAEDKGAVMSGGSARWVSLFAIEYRDEKDTS